MALIKCSFEYSEPRYGFIEIEGTDEVLEREYDYGLNELLKSQSTDFVQNMLDKIVEQYPEAIDIELTNLEYYS